MTNEISPTEFLNGCKVDVAVVELQPTYRALLLVAEGIEPQRTSVLADELISRAERYAKELLRSSSINDLPHIAAWREAYRSFGAKPQRTRNSLESLTRRAGQGLPRVNPLTDIYNAISVLHQIPLGGEDFDRYQGPAHLSRAAGDETFDTVAAGESIIEFPELGEVIWHDQAGVTCRRWNWRQGQRTALSDKTTTAFFILDALSPVTDDQLLAAGGELAESLSSLGSDVVISQRQIG